MFRVGGGVSANQPLRAALERMTAEEHAELYIPPLALCTDNAAMAAMAWDLLEAGRTSPLDVDVLPGLVRKHSRSTR